MEIPQELYVGVVAPLAVVTAMALMFSWFYVRYLQHHELSAVSSTLTSVFALFFALLTVSLVPVDVFLASFSKSSSGDFKDWATNKTTGTIEDAVLYSYYALYSVLALFVFIMLPFMYFYVEENDEETSTKQRVCSAIKYTIGFAFVMAVVLLVGAFAPLRQPPKNITAIDDKLNYLKNELEHYNDLETSMSFLIGCLSMLGTLMLIVYTAYGMSVFPLRMIRCSNCKIRKVEQPRNRLSRHERDAEQARILRAKANSGRELSSQELRTLSNIEEERRLVERMERRNASGRATCCGRILTVLKPLTILLGVVFFVFSILIVTALMITNIDKAQHSLGYKYGYALPHSTIPNPIEKIILFAQKVFPLDYVVFMLIVLTLLFASLAGLKRMGIWCFCVKLFRISAHRTLPQALLLMIFVVMFMTLAMNSLLFSVMPQYMVFGDQFYKANITNGTSSYHLKVKPCSRDAPQGSCIMTRVAVMMDKLVYKAWFFGAFYYWAVWAFLGVFLVGLVVNLLTIRRPDKTVVHDDESEDELLIQA